MRITRKQLRRMILKEMRGYSDYGMSDQFDQAGGAGSMSHDEVLNFMVRQMDYGRVGSVNQSPVDYGRYTMNNGVIGIIPPNERYGYQYYPAHGNGNPQAIFAKLKAAGYQEEGMPLDRSNNSEESLRRIAMRGLSMGRY